MRVFGLEISFRKAIGGVPAPVSGGSGNWLWPTVRESFTGAWQRGIEARPENVLSFHAVNACTTLIASDISKLRVKLVEQNQNGIWQETTSSAFSPVLTKPNRFQNRIQFLTSWILSKLIFGNTYVLKERDNRGVVVAMYILDPNRCKPLVAPDGSVYYQLGADWLSGVPDALPAVPASEIIHDRMNTIFHPLVGTSPLYACGLAASAGLNIQRNSTKFFANGARPAGVLTAPSFINDETAARLKTYWETEYSGENVGKIAVLGDGLKYEAMTMTAVDAQLIDQLKMSAEMVCSTFHVPPYMVGLAPMPAQIAVEALNQQYYTQCLQVLIESVELCLDEGLGLVSVPGHTYGTELDLDGLLRMDQAAFIKAIGDGIGAGLFSPNEGRKKFDLMPVVGGDTPYLQQQNFSLAALDKRDSLPDPFAGKTVPALPAPAAGAVPPAKEFDEMAYLLRQVSEMGVVDLVELADGSFA